MGGYNGLYRDPGMKITFKDAVSALSEKDTFPEMLVMPYLSGYEVSVDCLRTGAGLIIIPRIKMGVRVAEIRYDEEIINICKSFIKK
ncbi:MAG TPA: hypothetical protein DCP90_02465 [Clostridiales bacterium]|nr:hypothetical protein [Clostridiales bacterium]